MDSRERCCCCGVRKRGNSRFHPLSSVTDALEKINIRILIDNQHRSSENQRPHLKSLNNSSRVCHRCLSNITYDQVPLPNLEETPDTSIFRKAIHSHHYCMFSCGEYSIELVQVSSAFRFKLLREYKVFSVKGSRSCLSHLDVDNLWPIVKQLTSNVDDYKAVADLFFEFHQKFDASGKPKSIFDPEQPDSDWTSDDVFFNWTGFSKTQFQSIFQDAPGCKPVEVIVFLCKLRTALSNSQIGPLFGVCSRTVSNYILKVVKVFSLHLSSQYINTNSRQTLLQHKSPISSQLFEVPENQVEMIWDGTYRLVNNEKRFAFLVHLKQN